MHVLFVHTALPGTPFNSSIAALSAWLKLAGHTTALLRVADEAEDDAVAAAVAQSGAEVVGFSFMTCRAERVAEVVPLVRRALPDASVIAGGAHPTTYPEATLRDLGLDAVFLGESEDALLHWLSDRDTPHPGLIRQGQDDAIVRARVADVDVLPDWDRALFGDVSNAGNRYEEAVGVAFSRGFCPFTCTFCGIDGYRRIHGQATSGAIVLRDVDRVMGELRRVPQSVPVTGGFAVWDAIFPLERGWVNRFADAYAAEIDEPLSVQLRVEQVTEHLVAALARAGCDYAVVGVECGDETYRGRFLDKPFSNAACALAVERLQDAGIAVHASFMLGMPFETPKHLAETVRFARALQPAELSWKYYTPERWTRLFKLCQDNDLLIDRYIDHPFGAHEAMIRLTHCTQADLDKAQEALRMVRGAQQTAPLQVAGPAVELRT
jgi:anaerobic magnesium-protoporphyrin IX monomethyl ester cyclase